VILRFDTINSPDDWEIMCIPINFLTRRKAVDFPQDVAPMAVGTGHDSKIKYI
jgi:hypothetical protein